MYIFIPIQYTKYVVYMYIRHIVGGGEKKMTKHKFHASISSHTHTGTYFTGVRFLIGRLAYGHAYLSPRDGQNIIKTLIIITVAMSVRAASMYTHDDDDDDG